MGRCLGSLGVFPVALILAGCGRAPNTVDEVIERNTTAMGGRQAIEAVHSSQLTCASSIPILRWTGVTGPPGRVRCGSM